MNNIDVACYNVYVSDKFNNSWCGVGLLVSSVVCA